MQRCASTMAAEERTGDRRLIRIDVPPAHAGITAALRRAFAAAAPDKAVSDFEDLLRQLD